MSLFLVQWMSKLLETVENNRPISLNCNIPKDWKNREKVLDFFSKQNELLLLSLSIIKNESNDELDEKWFDLYFKEMDMLTFPNLRKEKHFVSFDLFQSKKTQEALSKAFDLFKDLKERNFERDYEQRTKQHQFAIGDMYEKY
jgi:hypothetical protein